MVELHTPGLVDNLVVSFILFLPLLLVLTILGMLLLFIRSKSSGPTVKRIAGISLILVCSSIIVLITLYLPKTINNPNQLNNITCGWPVPFLQFASVTNPPAVWTVSCIGWSGSPMDTKKEILWVPFLINILFVSGGITVLTYASRSVFKIRQENMKKIEKH